MESHADSLTQNLPKHLACYHRTLRMDVQYDGSAFVGWQRQAKGVSVQAVLEDALSKMASEKVVLFASSRTDAGVHARQQVTSFSLRRCDLSPEVFQRGLGSMLPPKIQVLRIAEAPLPFHANRFAEQKTYRYWFRPPGCRNVFIAPYAWELYRDSDVAKMQAASQIFVGRHDFSAFRTGEALTQSQEREILSVRWRRHLGLYAVDVRGTGFLRHMVRNMIGALWEVGRGRITPKDLETMLLAKRKVFEYPCAPAHALFLWRVKVRTHVRPSDLVERQPVDDLGR